MKRPKLGSASSWVLALALVSCEGKQYVSPDTVRLVVTDDSTNVDRVDRCNYVPELLGSEVRWRYVVEGDIKVMIGITRDQITVGFEGTAEPVDAFVVTPAELRQGSQTDDSAPKGYTVQLSAGCDPEKD